MSENQTITVDLPQGQLIVILPSETPEDIYTEMEESSEGQ
jgi:hypothetical protein